MNTAPIHIKFEPLSWSDGSVACLVETQHHFDLSWPCIAILKLIPRPRGLRTYRVTDGGNSKIFAQYPKCLKINALVLWYPSLQRDTGPLTCDVVRLVRAMGEYGQQIVVPYISVDAWIHQVLPHA